MVLHPLSAFIDDRLPDPIPSPSYWYEGRCPQTGKWLKLPRTALVETIAQRLMAQLAADLSFSQEAFSQEGKMYGVLLVETPTGDRAILKAFSGLLNGESHVEGWVPPIPGRGTVALEEAHTLAALSAIKDELLTLQQLPERQQYEAIVQDFDQRLQALAQHHAERKQHRKQQREALSQTLTGKALTIELAKLETESQRDGMERRNLKRQRNAQLQPLQAKLAQADARIRELKAERKTLSRQLQAQLHTAYSLANFAGQTRSLQQVTDRAMPTGTGDCCAPKLLHYAATHHLKPIAMAEFWWGRPSANQEKVPGAFYGACAERCQPLMGFLLSGLSLSHTIELSATSEPPTFLYEDKWLIVVNKPSGLLTIPGRRADRQDSVLSRLQYALPDGVRLLTVHRLDQGTSGILLIARDAETHRHLSQQFQKRQIQKHYEALLAGNVLADQGTIALPLWRDPTDRPLQKVNWQQGKPSLTHFRVLSRESPYTRVEFNPITGRTHQLRVHAAHPQGLGVPILGDRLYGWRKDDRMKEQVQDQSEGNQINQIKRKRIEGERIEGSLTKDDRLYLHAKALKCIHPQSGQPLLFECETPF
jgi:tRNA pseudouridine32 synthase/23S rRNA pseudouridine746 synthase